MNDFNSRYRNLDDQPERIRTNTGGYGYNGYGNNGGGRYNNNSFGNDMDIMQAENAQKKKQVARASQARGGSSSRGRKAKRQMLIYGGIILAEVIILAVIWILYFVGSGSDSKSSDNNTVAEGSENTDGSSEGQSGNINVENDNFTLTCTKISITQDVSGAPVAVVYFDFTNKTDQALSMSNVFTPSFSQAGATLMSTSALADTPAELVNSTTAISGGQTLTCAYAVTLNNTDSELTITMDDVYETFSTIGSVTVPLS